MKNYERPMATVVDELAEGVYASSGSGCFTTTCRFDGAAEYLGAENLYKYRVQVDATHNSDHTGTECRVRFTFNEAVTLYQQMDSSTSSVPVGASATVFEFSRANLFYNPGPEFVGLGSIVVTTTNPALAVPHVEMFYCNGAQ